MLCDYEGRTASGELVGVLLFQDGGKITELEVYSIDGEIQDPSGVFGGPLLASLQMLEWEPLPGNPNIRVPKRP